MPKIAKTKKVAKGPKARLQSNAPVIPTAVPVSKHRSLNSIFKFKHSRYNTEDVNEYNSKLRVMNKIDLQRECVRVELHPTDSRELMIERLIKQFRIHVAGNQAPPQPRLSGSPWLLRRRLAGAVSVSLESSPHRSCGRQSDATPYS